MPAAARGWCPPVTGHLPASAMFLHLECRRRIGDQVSVKSSIVLIDVFDDFDRHAL
jgi:hypothetical protein